MKKFKFLVGAVALFAIVVVNVWNAATVAKRAELNAADIEAIANPEPGNEPVLIHGSLGGSYLFGPDGTNNKQCYIVEDCRYSRTTSCAVVSEEVQSGVNPVNVAKCGYGEGGCVNKTCIDYI